MALPSKKGGALARLAAQLCQNPDFLHWGRYRSSDEAAQAIRDVCNIESRAQLDHDHAAAKVFHDTFRRPFAERPR